MSRSRLSVRTAVGDALALGFRRPVSVTVWGLASILCLVGTFALLDWGFAGFDLGRSEAPFDPHSLGEMLRFQGASGLINLATLGFTAVLLAAATRAGLGWPHGRSLAFMQIGLDEFRVLVIQVAMGVGAYFLLIPLVLIGVGVGLAVWPLEPVVRGVAIGATALALTVFFIWVLLRVVLITPMTVAVHKFSFIEGWRIARGRVWRLLGIAILSGLACILLTLVALIVVAVAVHLAGYDSIVDVQAIQDLDWSDQTWSPGWDLEVGRNEAIIGAVALLPLSWLLGMTLALSYAPWASAYRQIAPRPEPEPAPEPVVAPEPQPDPAPVLELEPEPQPEPEHQLQSSEPESAPEPEHQPEAASEVHDAAPTEPEHHAPAEEAAEAVSTPDAGEAQPHGDDSHPVADAPDADAVETQEDQHRG